jgi:hypothetical protein
MSPERLQMIAACLTNAMVTRHRDILGNVIVGVIPGVTVFMGMAKAISDKEFEGVVKDLLKDLPKDPPVLFFNRVSESVTGLREQDVLYERITEIMDKHGVVVQDSLAGYLVVCPSEEIEDMESLQEDLKVFEIDGKYHRILICTSNSITVQEINAETSDPTIKTRKGIQVPRQQISEINDPVRLRNTPITKDTLLDLQIALGNSKSIEEFLEVMDTIGN